MSGFKDLKKLPVLPPLGGSKDEPLTLDQLLEQKEKVDGKLE